MMTAETIYDPFRPTSGRLPVVDLNTLTPEQETATRLGATITLTPRTSYDYAKDPEWKRLSVEKLEPAKKLLKAQEELIKNASKGKGQIVDPDSGEVLAVAVPSTSSESVTVSLNKGKKS